MSSDKIVFTPQSPSAIIFMVSWIENEGPIKYFAKRNHYLDLC